MKRWWIIAVILGMLILVSIAFFKIAIIQHPDVPFSNKSEWVIIRKTAHFPRFYNALLPGEMSIENGDLIAFYDPRVNDTDPKDREILVRRVLGLPGNIVEIKNKVVYINQKPFDEWYPLYFEYRLTTSNRDINELTGKMEVWGIVTITKGKAYNLTTSVENASAIASAQGVVNIRTLTTPEGEESTNYFPQSDFYNWNKDFFGPVAVPQQHVTHYLNYRNIALSEQIIRFSENNTLEISQHGIKINDTVCEKYTFNKNYYFVMSDDRDHGADSRTFGFVPQDLIIGKIVY
ncbi:MAG TPA: S26 family signal peptidase [Bacteroidales bacterium]|nr:S26 family signal peptidase [Bacteroidales bacterium]HQP04245.1 S26 family signal peptidase [Bacteroidales bacterium]